MPVDAQLTVLQLDAVGFFVPVYGLEVGRFWGLCTTRCWRVARLFLLCCKWLECCLLLFSCAVSSPSGSFLEQSLWSFELSTELLVCSGTLVFETVKSKCFGVGKQQKLCCYVGSDVVVVAPAFWPGSDYATTRSSRWRYWKQSCFEALQDAAVQEAIVQESKALYQMLVVLSEMLSGERKPATQVRWY